MDAKGGGDEMGVLLFVNDPLRKSGDTCALVPLWQKTAAQIASFDYSKFRVDGEEERFVGFGGVEDCRFRGVVEPPCTMYFAVRLERAGSRMFKYSAEGFVERDGVLQPKRVFEATVLGVLL